MRAMCSLAAAMVVGGGALGVSIARLVLGLRQGLLRGCYFFYFSSSRNKPRRPCAPHVVAGTKPRT